MTCRACGLLLTSFDQWWREDYIAVDDGGHDIGTDRQLLPMEDNHDDR